MKDFSQMMARTAITLLTLFCFLGEAKASDVGLYGTWLESSGDNKIEVIRALRSVITNINLSDAKHLVESAPCFVLEHVTQEDAQACADALNAAGATAYVKEMDGKLLPYEYGFENNDLNEEGWSLVDCHYRTTVYGVISFTGDYSFGFNTSNNPPQYLISPKLVDRNSIRVSFWYRVGNYDYPETFQVGYSTTTDDVSAFTWGDEITASNMKWQWSKYQNIFPAGTKYVAVKLISYDKYILALDDFSFTEAAGMKGDVNLDGSVDISDVVLMVNYILGNDSSANVLQNGDMNDDQRVDISDVVALVNIILGNN